MNLCAAGYIVIMYIKIGFGFGRTVKYGHLEKRTFGFKIMIKGLKRLRVYK